jgi:hypothetical protein
LKSGLSLNRQERLQLREIDLPAPSQIAEYPVIEAGKRFGFFGRPDRCGPLDRSTDHLRHD